MGLGYSRGDQHLLAEIEATSHILRMLLKLIEAQSPGTIAAISETMDESLRVYLAGEEDELALSRAERFRMRELFTLDDRASRERYDNALLPKSPS